MKKGLLYFLSALSVSLAVAGVFLLSYFLMRSYVSRTDSALKAQNSTLSQEISSLKGQVDQLNSAKQDAGGVTSVVDKNVNQVVSVIITRDAPQYKIVYQDPFGSNGNSGFQIPVYLPTGKTEVQEIGAGSGIFLTSDGYILTNKHVVAGTRDKYTIQLSSGKKVPAAVIYRDPKADLAIVKVEGNGYSAASLGDSGKLQLGQSVVAIGNALGKYNNTVSVGVISGLNRSVQVLDEAGNMESISDVIQTDAPVNPGNSGGPLYDLNGNVVGINVAAELNSNNISFAIPINTAKTIINKVINK